MVNDFLRLDIKNRTNVIYNEYKKIAQMYMPEKWDDEELEFIIRESREINGCSKCEGKKDYIEINSGVIDLYYDYFYKVMKQDTFSILQKLLPDKTECELEKCSFEALIQREGKIEIIDSKIVDDSKAKLLEIFVSRFIILHELGHLLNGHCRWMIELTQGKESFIPMYYSNKERGITEEEALNKRTMEMDADAFAAMQSVVHLLTLYDNFYQDVKIANMKSHELFYWWAFAIRSHFLICEDYFLDMYYDKKMTHLPSCARWTDVYFVVMQVLEFVDKDNETKSIFKEMVTRGAFDAEFKFNKIKLTNYSWNDEIENSNEYRKYKEEIVQNWEKIKEKLKNYARLPLYDEATG